MPLSSSSILGIGVNCEVNRHIKRHNDPVPVVQQLRLVSFCVNAEKSEINDARSAIGFGNISFCTADVGA